MIDEPSLDDVPARDVHSDYDAVQEAERRLFGRDDQMSRYRDDAERLFAKTESQPELPIHSMDIFPPMRKIEAKVESVPEVKAEAPVEPPRRILQSVTWVDPVEQRLREEEERRQARRKGRPPREQRETSKARTASPRKMTGTRVRAQAAFDFTPPAPEPIPAPIATQALDQIVPQRLPALKTRARHPEPRILYNAWNYPRYLRDARQMPKDIAAIILKPGEGWKRRLPIAAWK
ncbi:MAG: hypothetical protein EOP83_13565 [Verrucomicrobiaceae bacterium]|nr:MAG: hypothetical protein EOP83_13565 [Verrucomicrobiaceae bacterium]